MCDWVPLEYIAENPILQRCKYRVQNRLKNRELRELDGSTDEGTNGRS
jgi:hypothetical protein